MFIIYGTKYLTLINTIYFYIYQSDLVQSSYHHTVHLFKSICFRPPPFIIRMINLVASPTFPPHFMLQTLALSVTETTKDIVLVFMHNQVCLSYRRMQYLYKHVHSKSLDKVIPIQADVSAYA